jgi:RNA recognition motif-containing protein
VYVTNLSYTAREGHVAKFFAEGVVGVRIPHDKDNRPKGICFVDFDSHAHAARAVKLHGAKLQGRELGIVMSDKESSGNEKKIGPQPEAITHESIPLEP